MVATNILAIRYGQSIFGAALDSDQLEAVNHDFDRIIEFVEQGDKHITLALSPKVPIRLKRQFWEQFLAKTKLHTMTENLLAILLKNNRINIISKVIANFRKLYLEHLGTKEVEVRSAITLTGELVNEFQKVLEQTLSSKIKIVNIVDKSLMGGLSIKVDSQMLDFSISSQLEQIRRELRTNQF
jgi:F-type H+-transporting ATPase subunit delta